jgi:hypothetical protein
MLSSLFVPCVTISRLFILVVIVEIGDLVETVINGLAFRETREKTPCNDLTCVGTRFSQCAML